MAFAEKKKPKEAAELNVRAELASALKENKIPEYGEGDNISRVAQEIKTHYYALEDEQVLGMVKNVAGNWGEIRGLEGNELEERIQRECDRVAGRESAEAKRDEEAGEGGMLEVRTGEQMKVGEPSFAEKEPVEVGPIGGGLRETVENYRKKEWSTGARRLREAEEEGRVTAEAAPPKLELAEGDEVSGEKAGGGGSKKEVSDSLNGWLAENGFSRREEGEEHNSLKKRIGEAEGKGYLAEKEKLVGELVAHLNGNIAKLRELRGSKGVDLEPAPREELDAYIARVGRTKNNTLLTLLESRYERVGKPAPGSSMLPQDMEVREAFSLGKGELADRIVAMKLDAETEKTGDKLGVRNYSVELADLEALEEMAGGAQGKDREELYRQMKEDSGRLLGKVKGKRGLFEGDAVLLEAFEKRVEALSGKNAHYAELLGEEAGPAKEAGAPEYEVVWSGPEQKAPEGGEEKKKGKEGLWDALADVGFPREQANEEYMKLEEENARAAERGDTKTRILTAKKAVKLIDDGLAALGRLEGEGLGEEAGMKREMESLRKILKERRAENAELLARLEEEARESEMARK